MKGQHTLHCGIPCTMCSFVYKFWQMYTISHLVARCIHNICILCTVYIIYSVEIVEAVWQYAIPENSLSLSISFFFLQLVDLFGGRRLPWCGCHVAGVWLRLAHTLSVGGQEVNHYPGRVWVRVWWRQPCCSQLHLGYTHTVFDQFCHIFVISDIPST